MKPLPLFSHILDPEVDRNFWLLCEAVSIDALPELLEAVHQHALQVRQALKTNEFLDVALAEKIAETLAKLLGDIENYPPNQKRLVVGAARYFVKSHDAQADLVSLLGFDDDVAVLNYVLVELGQSELRISL
jgi:uncharacterized membrane protein YkvA (DUF1232 family)